MTASNGQQWIRVRDRATGRPLFVAVPSRTVEGKFHLVSTAGCDCIGFGFRQTCTHFRAVVAELAHRKARPVPVEIPAGSNEPRPVRVPLIGRLMA